MENVMIAGSSNRLMRWAPPESGRGGLAPPEVPLEQQIDPGHGEAVHPRVPLAGARPVAGRYGRTGVVAAQGRADVEGQRSGAYGTQGQSVRGVDRVREVLVAHVVHA